MKSPVIKQPSNQLTLCFEQIEFVCKLMMEAASTSGKQKDGS